MAILRVFSCLTWENVLCFKGS